MEVKRSDVVEFDFTTHDTSGNASTADATPTYKVFEQGNAVAIATGNATARSDAGSYYVSLNTAAYTAAKWHSVVVTAVVDAITSRSVIGRFKVVNNDIDVVDTVVDGIKAKTDNLTFTTATKVDATIPSIYLADINYAVDEENVRDEYTVRWYKDGVLQTSITSPTLTVTKRDGTVIINAQAMTDAGGGLLYYNDTGRLSAGEAAEAKVIATIDGSPRTWSKIFGRDKLT